MTEKPTVDIIAEKLLCVLRAATPFCGKDEERPHLTMLRFTAERKSLEVAATDGHCLAMLDVPLEGAEPVVFCLLTTHVPMLVKALQRMDGEQRAELVVTITVGKTKVRFDVGETEIMVPKGEQQTEFPTGPLAPLRFDVVEGELGITGLFVVMPMKGDDGAERDLKDAGRRLRHAVKSLGGKATLETSDGRQTVIE